MYIGHCTTLEMGFGGGGGQYAAASLSSYALSVDGSESTPRLDTGAIAKLFDHTLGSLPEEKSQKSLR